jgi:hypothetical protein
MPTALTTFTDSSTCQQKIDFQDYQCGQMESFFVVKGVVFSMLSTPAGENLNQM